MHNLFYFCTMWNLHRGFLGRRFKGGSITSKHFVQSRNTVVPNHCTCTYMEFVFTFLLLWFNLANQCSKSERKVKISKASVTEMSC